MNIDAESSNLSQVFTTTDSQTLFNLTAFTYTVGGESVSVYRNGQRLVKGVDWVETTSSSITLQGITVAAGEVVEVVAVLGAASDASIAAQAAATAAVAAAASITIAPGEAIVTQDSSKTGATRLTAGTTAQRPASPASGFFRFNTTLGRFEGYGASSWGSVGGATGGGGDDAFYENTSTITADYTIATGKNAMSAGPMTINSGVTVTVPNGSVWTVV